MENADNNLQFIDFNNICRLCLRTRTIYDEFISIFHRCSSKSCCHQLKTPLIVDDKTSKPEDEVDADADQHDDTDNEMIINILNLCIHGLLIEENDDLPTYICGYCLELSRTFNGFRKKSIESSRILNEIKFKHFSNFNDPVDDPINSNNAYCNDDDDDDDNATVYQLRTPEMVIVDDIQVKIDDSLSRGENESDSDIELTSLTNRNKVESQSIIDNKIGTTMNLPENRIITNQKQQLGNRKSYKKLTKQCNICGIIIKSVSDHMRVHPQALPYKCGQCNRRYLTQIGLDRHSEVRHNYIIAQSKFNISKSQMLNQSTIITPARIATPITEAAATAVTAVATTTAIQEKQKFIRNQRQLSKTLLNQGAEHFSRGSNRVIPAKYIGAPCTSKCKQKCISKVNDEQRQQLFTQFWELGSVYRHWEYISQCLEEIHPKYRRKILGSNRSFNLAYYFCIDKERVRVCQQFFCRTLGIGEGMVRTVKRKCDGNGKLIEKDKRGSNVTKRRV